MIVTVTGAYRNCGDHLIGARARALLRAHVDENIENVDRMAIDDSTYGAFNRARAVMLCGGPAYQKHIYPNVYPIDRSRLSRPLIPYGLGWKAAVNQELDAFSFAPEAFEFVRGVHEGINASSVRDPLTLEMLRSQGLSNVIMTGCPAWYDLEYIERDYRFVEQPSSIVLSMPAVMQPGTFELMAWLSTRFPKARRTLAFHHGMIPVRNRVGFKRARQHAVFSASAIRRGWQISSLAGSLEKMEALYTSADLHVGFRVHGHLLALSRRRASILINEDSRGVGQAKALGQEILVTASRHIEPWKRAVENHFAERGADVAKAVDTMRTTYPEMKRFLASV